MAASVFTLGLVNSVKKKKKKTEPSKRNSVKKGDVCKVTN